MRVRLREDFGKRVRQLRKARKWTQEHLAEKAGMEYKHLGAIERGEKNATINNIEKIARGLEVEPQQLFLFSLGGLKPEADIARDKVIDLIDTIPAKARLYVIEDRPACLPSHKGFLTSETNLIRQVVDHRHLPGLSHQCLDNSDH
jgi:transcriptional regulator with XRE-family HTH domain